MVKEQYEDPDDEENSFVVVPSERKFPRAIERILGDVGFKKANIICENVNDKLATELGDAMCHNKSLETLNLYLNKISDVGAIAIARSITPLSALSELNLGGNKIGDKGAEAIAAGLTVNATMRKLILDRNLVTSEGARSLSVALERNESLDTLCLHRNHIGDDGARAIGKALCYNHKLRLLQLDENGIGDSGIGRLSLGVEQNKGVEQLHLNYNKIGNTGAQRLAKALFKNRTIRVLRLSNNLIGDEGVVGNGSIGDMMSQNFMKLEKLYIDQNRISEEAGRRLAKDLHRRNRGFKFLHFTVRNKVSLETQLRNENLKSAATVDDSDDELERVNTGEQIEQLVHRMKSLTAHTQQKAAKEFLDLLKWSERERGHDIERFRAERDKHQAILDEEVGDLETAREVMDAAKEKLDDVQHEIQVLMDASEFVSMKTVHEKQEKERTWRDAQAKVDELEANRHELSQKVANADHEISALHEGNEVQLRSPDLGAVGALLHMLYPREANEENMQTLTLTMSLRGIRIQQMYTNPKLIKDIVTNLSDEVGLSPEAITLDMDNLREQEDTGEQSSASATFASMGAGSDGTTFHFDLVMPMKPGSQLIYLKHKFRVMAEAHENRQSKFETTDAVKFALKMERDVIEKNPQWEELRFGFVGQECTESRELVVWPNEELRASDLNPNWPTLICQFLDDSEDHGFANDTESPWAQLRDEWPPEMRIINDWKEEEAAVALAQLLKGNTDCQEVAIAEGAVELLLAQLLSGSDWTKAAVAGAITTLADGNKQAQKKLKEAHAIELLTGVLAISNTRMRESVEKALRVLVPPPKFKGYTVSPAVYMRGVDIEPVNKPKMLGGKVVKFSGILPAGLILNEKTGEISGVALQDTPKAKFTITATNFHGEDTFDLSITVLDVPPVFQGYQHNPVKYMLQTRIERNTPVVTGGEPKEFKTRGLPDGLTLNTKTGVITGKPVKVQAEKNYEISCVNSGGSSSTKVSITIMDVPPEFHGTGYYNNPAEYIKSEQIIANRPRLRASGKMKYAIKPTLPEGLYFDTDSGNISGTPLGVAPRQTFIVTATNTGGTDTVELKITVHENALTAMLAIAENEQASGAGRAADAEKAKSQAAEKRPTSREKPRRKTAKK